MADGKRPNYAENTKSSFLFAKICKKKKSESADRLSGLIERPSSKFSNEKLLTAQLNFSSRKSFYKNCL